MKKPFLNVTTGLVSFGWWWLYLGLNFVIEELLLELGESVVTAVVIQIQRVQHIPKGRRVLVHVIQLLISKPQPVMGWSYSIMEGSLVSRMWSVRIQGMDISMGNWIRRPMVSSRKNSLNHSWERSQHCCRASAKGRENEGMSTPLQASLRTILLCSLTGSTHRWNWAGGWRRTNVCGSLRWPPRWARPDCCGGSS